MDRMDKRCGNLSYGENAIKYHESLHFLSECHWCELTSADCSERMEPGLN